MWEEVKVGGKNSVPTPEKPYWHDKDLVNIFIFSTQAGTKRKVLEVYYANFKEQKVAKFRCRLYDLPGPHLDSCSCTSDLIVCYSASGTICFSRFR